jgi:hypothetical protein
VVVVAVIAIFGYYQTKVRPKGETVIQVGDHSFSLRYLERRLRYDIHQGNTIYLANPAQAADFLVNEIGREELTRQGALEKGVDLSEEAIDTEIRSEIGVPGGADRNAFAAKYRDAVRESGLSTDGYRDVIAAGLAEEALRAMFEGEVTETAEQVRYRLIQLSTEDDAKAALERLQSGEDFAALAQELSQDAASGEQGGEQDWTPQGLLDLALGEGLFSLEIGEVSDIITGVSALFIVEVLEREAERELTPIQQSSLASRAMEGWLSELSERLSVTVTLDGDMTSSLLEVLQSEAGREQ